MRSPLLGIPVGTGTWLLLTAVCTAQSPDLSPPNRPGQAVVVLDSGPHNMSVLYSNQSSDVYGGWSELVDGVLTLHESHGEPGIAIITWLSPGTVQPGPWGPPIPGCPHPVGPHARPATGCAFHGPGFRTDTVQPYQQTCVHFVAPSGRVAVEFRVWVAEGGGSMRFAATDPSGGIAWSSDSSWRFDGKSLKPAGTVDSSFDGLNKVWVRKVVQGC